jgi:predicted ATPase
MIERIVIENFKSLRKVDLKLGRMNLFIGSNASGKSNFFDALRVLQGIGNGFTISEILDGKPRSATSEVWEGIRGGSAKALLDGAQSANEIRLLVTGRLPGKAPGRSWRYSISFLPIEGKVTHESLSSGLEVFDSDAVSKNSAADPVIEVRYYSGQVGRQPHLKFERSRPVLTQFARSNGGSKVKKSDTDVCAQVARVLANMQRIDPSPMVLRGYSQAQQIDRMGERGENFAALVRTIERDPATKDAYLSWLRQLRPAEVDDVGTLSGAVGEPLFMLREHGREQPFPATVLSDGTLRFAAITAAFFQPDMPGIMTIEEIENGIHASRVRLLVDLLRQQAARGATQVIATTHSPIVLAWLTEAEYANTYFCKRDEASGESRVCALPQVPHFIEVVSKQPIADLFAEGWLEAAL